MEKPTDPSNPLPAVTHPKKVGHAIVQLLRDVGVTHVFGIPDGHTLAFYDGFQDTPGIEHILVNDERTAGFAADAYARVSGRLGVCDAGAAGAMNFPVALAEAKGFGSPVLAIIGQVKSEDMLRNVPHDINVTDTLAGITKWSERVILAEHLPRFLNQAIRIATNGKPGPVAITIAEDVLTAEAPFNEPIASRHGAACAINGCRVAAAAGEIEEAVQLIRKSSFPAIYSGGRAVISGAFHEIEQLSSMLCAPVFSTISGKGIMRDTPDSNYFGTIGLFGEKPNHKFLRKSTDLLIVVGNRLTEDDTANFKLPPQRLNMIQIDIDPAEIGLSFNPLGVVGDCQATLQAIIHSLTQMGVSESSNLEEIMVNRKKNLDKLREERQDYLAKDQKNWIQSQPIKPQRVLYAISQALGPQDYLVTDASASSRWIGSYYPVKEAGLRIITARGVGPTGFGVGVLLGTCMAVRELYGTSDTSPKVVLFTGDGGLMNGGLADLETLVRLKFNCTIVVINNRALGFVKFGQIFMYRKRLLDTDRPTTNFAAIITSLGGIGHHVENLSDLDSTIHHAVHSKGVHLIDVMVDPQELLPPHSY